MKCDITSLKGLVELRFLLSVLARLMTWTADGLVCGSTLVAVVLPLAEPERQHREVFRLDAIGFKVLGRLMIATI